MPQRSMDVRKTTNNYIMTAKLMLYKAKRRKIFPDMALVRQNCTEKGEILKIKEPLYAFLVDLSG